MTALDAIVARGTAKAATITVEGTVVLETGEPASRAHAAVLGALDDALTLISAGADRLPFAARTMLTVVRSQRGAMVDALNRMEPAQLHGVLGGLRDRIEDALSDA